MRSDRLVSLFSCAEDRQPTKHLQSLGDAWISLNTNITDSIRYRQYSEPQSVLSPEKLSREQGERDTRVFQEPYRICKALCPVRNVGSLNIVHKRSTYSTRSCMIRRVLSVPVACVRLCTQPVVHTAARRHNHLLFNTSK